MPKKQTKNNSISIFFSSRNLRLKSLKITSGFTLTEQSDAGNYHIIFLSVTSKVEFSSEPEIGPACINMFHFLVVRCVVAMC